MTDQLANNYRHRITDFIERMSVAPIKENDYYTPSATKLNQLMNFKGPDYVKFGAPRCD